MSVSYALESTWTCDFCGQRQDTKRPVFLHQDQPYMRPVVIPSQDDPEPLSPPLGWHVMTLIIAGGGSATALLCSDLRCATGWAGKVARDAGGVQP